MEGPSQEIAIEDLKPHDHLCCIYQSFDDKLATLAPFFRAGLAGGERCIYVADEKKALAILEGLRKRGLGVEDAVRGGALVVVKPEDLYGQPDRFTRAVTIETIRAVIHQAKADGFRAVRGAAEMSWVLGHDASMEELVEYENVLNKFFPVEDVGAICLYDYGLFSKDLIRDIIYTHPIVIFEGKARRNPHFIRPEDFVRPRDPGQALDRMLGGFSDRGRDPGGS